MSCGTLAGIGLTLAGTGADMYANNQIRSKMNDTVGQEMARNSQYQKQGQQVFQNSLAQSTPTAAKQQIGQGQQQLAGLIQQARATPLSASMPSFGDVNTQGQQARADMSDTASSNLGGYSNFALQQRLKDQQAGEQLGVINQNAQGWANILPAQLQQDQQSQQGLQALGQLLSIAGMVTGVGAASMAPAASTSTGVMQDAANMAMYDPAYLQSLQQGIGYGVNSSLFNPTLLGY